MEMWNTAALPTLRVRRDARGTWLEEIEERRKERKDKGNEEKTVTEDREDQGEPRKGDLSRRTNCQYIKV